MEDIFAEQSYGKVALAKMKPQNPDFSLYFAGWLGDYNTTDTMEVRGAVFREAKSGPNKGKLVIKVPSSDMTAYVTVADMKSEEEKDHP